MTTVKFIKIGRNKISWDEVLPIVTEDTIVAAVLRKGALMSQDVDAAFAPSGGAGTIIAGLGHSVGRFEVEEEAGVKN